MKSKCLTALILFLMSKPLVMVVPGQPSQIPTTGSMVEMYGNIQGKPQAYQAEMTAFVEKVNEVNREVFNFDPDLPIIVKNTAFVMANATFGTAQLERFDLPFSSIQDAIDAITPGSLNWCIIVYSGSYTGNITMTDELNMYCYGGVTINGNIQLANNTHLQFDCGSVVNGNIIDNGVSVISEVCGCLVHEGDIILSGGSSILTISGRQMHKATVSSGSTLNCYFERMKASTASRINGSGNAVINIYNLEVLSTGYVNPPINMALSSGVLNMYNCIVNSTGQSVFFGGAGGVIWNCKVISQYPAITCSGVGTFQAVNNYLESTQDQGVLCVAGTSAKLILRRNYITVANSTNANQDGIMIDSGNALVLEENAIIGKGTGNSVNSVAAVNIKSLRGNGSNKVVNANVTETVDVIFMNAGYE